MAAKNKSSELLLKSTPSPLDCLTIHLNVILIPPWFLKWSF